MRSINTSTMRLGHYGPCYCMGNASGRSSCGTGWAPLRHPSVAATTKLCDPTTSRPIVHDGSAANHEKHEPQNAERSNCNDMDADLYLRHRSPRCSCL